MKLYKALKCLLGVVHSIPKYRREVIYLSQETFRTIVRSSQRGFPIDLKGKVQINDIDCIAPRLTKPDSERFFGITYLPKISYKDNCLVNLLIGFSNKVYLFES